MHTARLIATTRLADEELIRLFQEAEDREDDAANAVPGSEAEFLITFCARVSNPSNQKNLNTSAKLLRYLMAHKHWSPLQMASMTVEIETTRAISPQILRHSSFGFQEFSQRYADPSALPPIPLPMLRRQDEKNRQASHDDLDPKVIDWFTPKIHEHYQRGQELYAALVGHGVAKECAREVLPIGTPTRLYMAGTIRSWLHYLQVRDDEGVQLEHRLVAQSVKGIFCREFPTIASAMDWA